MKKIFNVFMSLSLLVTCACAFKTSVYAEEIPITTNNSIKREFYNAEKGYIVFGTTIYRDGLYWDISTSDGLLNYVSTYRDTTFTEIFDEIYLSNIISDEIVLTSNPYDLPASVFFTSVSWVNRSSDGWNLSLVPKSDTRNRYQNAVNGWTAIVKEQSKNSHWKNAESLQSQYYCHWTFANQKEDWNLSVEIPYRGDMIWDWYNNKCN